MSRIVESQESVALPLEDLYQPIAGELRQVESLLRQELRSKFPYVDELVRYGCLLGGKRLRPALVLLVAKSLGQVTHHHITLATVIEMIHTATLVHDDVLDEASVRRHLATVNARWDNEASVLLGDFLFSHAFFLASTTGSTTACRLIGQSTNIVCEGEMRQKGSRADFSLTETDYLDILDAKTGQLTACSCQIGACFADASPQQIERLTNFGRLLGIAFQIADDLLDITGDQESTGKSLGTDLAKQKPTLPIIRALELADDQQHNALLALLTSPEDANLDRLLRIYEDLHVLDYTREKAIEYADQALCQLDFLPSSPAEQSLRTLAEFVVNRSH